MFVFRKIRRALLSCNTRFEIHPFASLPRKLSKLLWFCSLVIVLAISRNLLKNNTWWIRSSRQEVFCQKGVLRNFAKFTGNTCVRVSFFNKVASLRPATLLKKRLWHRCFPVNFTKFLRTQFCIEHPWWLLMNLHQWRIQFKTCL